MVNRRPFSYCIFVMLYLGAMYAEPRGRLVSELVCRLIYEEKETIPCIDGVDATVARARHQRTSTSLALAESLTEAI